MTVVAIRKPFNYIRYFNGTGTEEIVTPQERCEPTDEGTALCIWHARGVIRLTPDQFQGHVETMAIEVLE